MSEPPHHNASDIPRGNWIDRLTPQPALPYLRLARIDRPIGTWLLLLPGWWALALAPPNGGWPDPWLIVLFGVGAILMRGGGCVINDLFDRDFDARVARTADRPIASGAISIPRALLFLAVLFGISLLILLSSALSSFIWSTNESGTLMRLAKDERSAFSIWLPAFLILLRSRGPPTTTGIGVIKSYRMIPVAWNTTIAAMSVVAVAGF